MVRVLCLEDQKEYFFHSTGGYDAIQKMLYNLNKSHKDPNASIELCNGRTWTLTHTGRTYATLA